MSDSKECFLRHFSQEGLARVTYRSSQQMVNGLIGVLAVQIAMVHRHGPAPIQHPLVVVSSVLDLRARIVTCA